MKTLLDREELVFNPPDLGCVLYLPGLPGGGSKIDDRSPYGNQGTITGASWKRLPSGLWCLSFDGQDDYVDCGDQASLDIGSNQDFTIEAWIKTADLGVNSTILSKRAGSGHYYVFRLMDSGKLRFLWDDGTSGNVDSDSVWDDDAWHLVAIARQGTSVVFYVDGGADGSDTKTIGDLSNSASFQIGIYNTGQHPFNGSIALPRFYKNRALSALEIQNHFNQEKHLFGVW